MIGSLQKLLQATAGVPTGPVDHSWDTSYATFTGGDTGILSVYPPSKILASEGAGRALALSNDGSYLFILGDGLDTIYRIPLSTPYMISSAGAYDNSLSVGAYDTVPSGMVFAGGGTHLYVVGSSNDMIHHYTLTTPYYIGNATRIEAISVPLETIPEDVWVSEDGLHLAIVGQSQDTVRHYDLSPAYSLAGMTSSGSLAVGFYEPSPGSAIFKPDGTKVYVSGLASDVMLEYTLSTAWDLSTATPTYQFTLKYQSTTSYGSTFSSDGVYFYVHDMSYDLVYQYVMSTPWDLSTAAFAGPATNFLNVTLTNEYYTTSLAFSSDGSKLFTLGYGIDRILQWSLSTPWAIHTATYQGQFAYGSALEGSAHGIAFSPDGTHLYIVGASADTVRHWTLDTPWDVTGTKTAQASFGVAVYESSSTDLDFNPDGTMMYLLGSSGDDITYFSLSTPWDVSTAVQVGARLFNSTFGDSVPTGFCWKPDGTKLFLVGQTYDTVRQYTVSTPWDLSSTVTKGTDFPIGVEYDSSPQAIEFKPDGTQFYICGIGTPGAVWAFDIV